MKRREWEPNSCRKNYIPGWAQAEFYYERDSLLEHRLHVDEFRCHFNKGEVTLASKERPIFGNPNIYFGSIGNKRH